MYRIGPPKYVLQIMERLERRGYAAYMVGGCVRDMLLGRRPGDWDLCSSALPDALMRVFPRSRPTGLKHGTVTVYMHGAPVEVTTFRTDAGYSDHRRPDTVHFVAELERDLARRDFTVNAISMNAAGEISDPFHGRDDLDKRLIRCVGDPEKRFDEDALRMLRAFRFSAVLDFTLEDETRTAIRHLSGSARGLARERIRAEIEKILLSPVPETLAQLIACGLLDGLTENKASPELSGLRNAARARLPRWAALCALLRADGTVRDTEAFLKALRLDTAAVRACSCGCAIALSGAPENAVGWKRLLSRFGESTAACAAAAADALGAPGHLRKLRTVLKSGECFSRPALAVGGGDLLTLGFRGTELGRALSALLTHVISFPQDNDRAFLLDMAKRL